MTSCRSLRRGRAEDLSWPVGRQSGPASKDYPPVIPGACIAPDPAVCNPVFAGNRNARLWALPRCIAPLALCSEAASTPAASATSIGGYPCPPAQRPALGRDACATDADLETEHSCAAPDAGLTWLTLHPPLTDSTLLRAAGPRDRSDRDCPPAAVGGLPGSSVPSRLMPDREAWKPDPQGKVAGHRCHRPVGAIDEVQGLRRSAPLRQRWCPSEPRSWATWLQFRHGHQPGDVIRDRHVSPTAATA